jgi:hypothetical protein
MPANDNRAYTWESNLKAEKEEQPVPWWKCLRCLLVFKVRSPSFSPPTSQFNHTISSSCECCGAVLGHVRVGQISSQPRVRKPGASKVAIRWTTLRLGPSAGGNCPVASSLGSGGLSTGRRQKDPAEITSWGPSGCPYFHTGPPIYNFETYPKHRTSTPP